MWTLDVAREQCPRVEHLYEFAATSLDAGYDALGLYLEHRFAFPSAPWAHGDACLTPDMVRSLRQEFPSLQIVPFINLLGHMEGFLNCEEGSAYRETQFRGMQGCPSNKDFVKFCDRILDDTLEAFDSELIHLGGDETWELGSCQDCREKLKASLWGEHFSRYCGSTLKKGRRPAVWGDMVLEHPAALEALPTQTLIFDWQYRTGVRETAPKLAALGHEVVACPTLHVYDAAWMHLDQSDQNVREVSRDASDLGLHGVCLTTWECGLFGAYDTVLPAVSGARAIMDDPVGAPHLETAFGDDESFARIMGRELNELGGVFAFDGHRSRLKCRLLLYANPFLAWMEHGEELSGDRGQQALALCERALSSTRHEGLKGAALFVRGAVEFVRMAEAGHRWYAQGEPENAIRALAPSRHLFDTLAQVARRTHERIGGSQADIERCLVAKEHVERVINRVRKYGRGELGYRPSFDVLTHPRFVAHDQACWWGVNKWGDQ